MIEPWFKTALMYWGVDEIPGPDDNQIIIDWFKWVKIQGPLHDEIPNCSAGLNAFFGLNGIKGTESPLAQSWLNWGIILDNPKLQCVCILKSLKNSWQGHCGILCAFNFKSIVLFGCNQDNSTNFKIYDKSLVLGYRWPKLEYYNNYTYPVSSPPRLVDQY